MTLLGPGAAPFMLYAADVGSPTEASVLRAVVGEDEGRAKLQRSDREVVGFVRSALQPLPSCARRSSEWRGSPCIARLILYRRRGMPR